MDTRAPHDIRGFHDLDAMEEKERKNFVPIPEAEVVDLEAMPPKERAEWLRNRRQRTIDKARASRVAQTTYDREMRQLENLRASVGKSMREKESVSNLLGYILGTRAFIREFLAEERAIVNVLGERCGVSRADYTRVVHMRLHDNPTPKLHDLVAHLVDDAPVFEQETKLFAGERPDLPVDCAIKVTDPKPEVVPMVDLPANPTFPEPESGSINDEAVGSINDEADSGD